MLEQKNLKKLKEKRKSIINRLKELNLLPIDLTQLNEEQKVIYDKINEFDFSYWEQVKIDNGWTHNRKSDVERELVDKKKYIRNYFRNKGVLPTYGDSLTEEQQKILDDIESGDFTYFNEYVNNVKINLRASAKKLTHGDLNKKKQRVKALLRKYNVLSAVGEPINEEQQKILDDIERGDFTYYENFKNQLTNKNYKPNVVENQRPKMVFHRLRLVGILPPIDQEFNEEQQAIIDDVRENWEGKTKNHYIVKYMHLSTPEGRLYYRLYKAHRDFGYNFNIDVSDIVIPEYCPLLNIKLSTDPKDKDNDNYYTGDRRDSSKGYVKGNIQVISLKANRMKNKSTQEQLLKFAVNGLNLIKTLELYGKNS